MYCLKSKKVYKIYRLAQLKAILLVGFISLVTENLFEVVVIRTTVFQINFIHRFIVQGSKGSRVHVLDNIVMRD